MSGEIFFFMVQFDGLIIGKHHKISNCDFCVQILVFFFFNADGCSSLIVFYSVKDGDYVKKGSAFMWEIVIFMSLIASQV